MAAVAAGGLLPAISALLAVAELSRCDQEVEDCQPLALVVLGPFLLAYIGLVLLPLTIVSVMRAMDASQGSWRFRFALTAAAAAVFVLVGFAVLSMA